MDKPKGDEGPMDEMDFDPEFQEKEEDFNLEFMKKTNPKLYEIMKRAGAEVEEDDANEGPAN
jgi:hypothetical protein